MFMRRNHFSLYAGLQSTVLKASLLRHWPAIAPRNDITGFFQQPAGNSKLGINAYLFSTLTE
jgi:hypothetical protein